VIKVSYIESKAKFKYLNALEKNLLLCISCGDCREAVDITSGKWGVCVARDHTSGFEPFFGRGKMQIIRSIWEGKLNLSKDLAEVFYQCPTCNACSATCAYNFNNVNLYEALRAELVDAGFGLEAHKSMNEAIINLLNPYGRENTEKSDWTKNLEFKIKDAASEPSDILYFVGCTAALTPDIQKVAVSTAKVLKKLNIDFAILGQNEPCCGSVAMRTGDRRAFNSIASKNLELIKQSGAKIIITSCAGCYRTLKIDYADMLKDLDITILHTIEFLNRYIQEHSIRLKHLGFKVTYHDPCHTGRHIGLYDEPRTILKQIADLTEMGTIKENAKCCGAGGGVKKAFPELSLEIAKSRINEAIETNADYILSICPFCFRNLSDAIKALNSDLKMIDLLELVYEALE